MNLFSNIKNDLQIITADILADKGYEDAWFAGVTVEPPRDETHGDMATNVAMVLCKRASMKPRDLAELVAEKLRNLPMVTEVSIAGPGFINMRFDAQMWQAQLAEILSVGVGYGSSTIGANERVNVEYVSANPTGPMHIGHARGAVVGDALALLLSKAGFDVCKEYYMNDAGGQIEVLARSAYLRYREACGEDIGAIPEGLYPGEYLISAGKALHEEYGDKLLNANESEWLVDVKRIAVDAMMNMIRSDLNEMGIVHDVFTSEKTLHDGDEVQKGLDKLDGLGLIYQGVLEPPKGKLPDDWESREQTLFKSTDFGDDADRAIAKSDGSWTYFAADVAYTDNKLARGFSKLIMVLGADHGGYVKRMQAVVKALSGGEASLNVQLCQIVKFMDNGVPVKMSKRAGVFTTVRDVVDVVGRDVVRFIMLTRKPEQMLDFDLEKVKEQSKDNPVFYVQYAHARCHSLLKMAAAQAPDAVEPSNAPTSDQLALLSSDGELSLIRTLANWPRIVESAAVAYEPHRIAYYLQDVASAFHGFWNAGNDNASLRFVQDDVDVTVARLALARSVATVIASGLTVLGVEPRKEMR